MNIENLLQIFTGTFRFKGIKSNYTKLLNITDIIKGDIYYLEEDEVEYVYDGIRWIKLGCNIDLSNH